MMGCVLAWAENWPRFRGPTGQGVSTESNLPTQWSPTENIRWKVAIPGAGWSSPVVWDDRVFVTTAADDGVSCRLVCVDRKSGAVLWNNEVLRQQPPSKERKNSHATPTPATDGKRVYTVFGDGSVVAVDFGGNVVWTNRDAKYYSRHGLGASPMLYDNLVIMPYDGSNFVSERGKWPNNPAEEQLGWRTPWDKAQLIALDASTGQRVWTGKRGMSRIAHVTPLLLEENGTTQLVSCAGDVVQGFNPRTGERIWSVYSKGEGVTPSPAIGDGHIFTATGFEKQLICAVRTGGKGDITDSHIAWEQRKGAPTQPSLLYLSPYLYAISDGGIGHCYDGKTGEIIWEERIGGDHCASPVYADGKIYFLSERGETAIINASPEFKIVARNTIDVRCQASIAVSQGNLFIRSENNLFCIGR